MKSLSKLLLLSTITAHGFAMADDGATRKNAEKGSKDNPVVINAASKNPLIGEYSLPKDLGGYMYFKIENVPPSRGAQYIPSVVVDSISINPFTRPSTTTTTPTSDGAQLASSKAQIAALTKSVEALASMQGPGVKVEGFPFFTPPPPTCDEKLQDIVDELTYGGTTAEQVPGILSKLNTVSGCEYEKEKITNTTTLEFDSTVQADEILRATVVYKDGSGEKEIASLTYKGVKKQWVTHTGWTFVHSKDREFYSLKNENNTYSIAENNSQKSINHALSIMYSYPYWEPFNDIYAGPAGILGLSQNGLLVGAGFSFMVTENFAINASVIATEFDRLNGVYSIGQNIGNDALDSSALSSKKIMTSWAITLGFRFE